MIICIDGLDGAGKTTQALLLQNAWRQQGRQATYCHFPVYDTPTGALLREYLRGGDASPEAVALLFAANRHEAVTKFGPAARLGSPDLVILDRYVPSGLVYGMEDELDRDWLVALNAQLPVPAITFILDASILSVQERLQKRANGSTASLDRYEQDPDAAWRIRGRFQTEAATQGWRTVDADQDPEALHEEIVKRIRQYQEEQRRPQTAVWQPAGGAGHTGLSV